MSYANYSMIPSFGNVSESAANSTHLPEVYIWSLKQISSYTVSFIYLILNLTFNLQFTHIINDDSGKKIYKTTTNPCDKKFHSGMDKLMRMSLNIGPGVKTEDIIPVTWICPIKKVHKVHSNCNNLYNLIFFQGASIIKSELKTTKFDFFVPSFFAMAGTFHWHEYFTTKFNGKPTIFLRSFKIYSVEVDDDKLKT